MGRVVESASEFYSARLSNKERSNNFTEDILKDKFTKDYLKRGFNQVQQSKKAIKIGGRGPNKKKRRN